MFKHLVFGDGGTEQIAWNKKCNELCNVLEGNECWKIKQTWTRELGECGARSFRLSTVWSRADITMRMTPEPRLEGKEAASPWSGGEEDPGKGNHGHQQGAEQVWTHPAGLYRGPGVERKTKQRWCLFSPWFTICSLNGALNDAQQPLFSPARSLSIYFRSSLPLKVQPPPLPLSAHDLAS